MMNQVYKTLPDDRPITELQVVEDVDRCPKGFLPVSKTYDQDSDADLWRESGFFGRKCTRYLCISKTQKTEDHIMESVTIINDKETPPKGFKTIAKTSDTEQKAWRKRQLCYKLAHITSCQSAVTDIIVLSRMKKAPEEFILLGEINGMTLCYKIGKPNLSNNAAMYPHIPYPVLPFPREDSSRPAIPPRSFGGGPENNVGPGPGPDVIRPLRPAPKPPASTYSTLSGYNSLEGVPFILNPKFNFSNSQSKDLLKPKIKTKAQIEEEYFYEFRTEHET